MRTIIISPFSRQLRNGQPNAKNYPFWPQIISGLNNFHTIQIGLHGEELLGTKEHRMNMPFGEVCSLVQSCDTWISVDNFMGHLGHFLKKQGIVIFGKSNPAYFGYPTNINLLKSHQYLRPDQWRWWEDVAYEHDAFVDPEIVVKAVKTLIAAKEGTV